jgi:hypothetical protein
MLKFLDKYEKYLVYIIYFVVGCFFIKEYLMDGEFLSSKNSFWDNIKFLVFLFAVVPLMVYVTGKYLFGGLIILFLRFIAHLVEHANLNLYIEDVTNRDPTKTTLVGLQIILGLILYAICSVLLTYIFEFLFQDYGIHFVDKLVEDYFILLNLGYLFSIGIVFLLAYLVHLNPFAVLISLVGLVILLPNLFRYNVNQIESIEKLLATVKIFFGLLFLILPWLFDRSYKRIE